MLKGGARNEIGADQGQTRAQREEIVRRALCDGGCDGCSGCGNLGGGRVEEMYRPYIEGKKELREINESYRANFVRG